jgi:hypothetical protein
LGRFLRAEGGALEEKTRVEEKDLAKQAFGGNMRFDSAPSPWIPNYSKLLTNMATAERPK